MKTKTHNVLVVGEANPRPGFHDCALWPWPTTGAGGRLAAHLGMRAIDFYHAFTLRNLYNDGAPVRWCVGDSRLRAMDVLCVNLEPVVVLLGNRVAAAFECAHLPLFRSVDVTLFGNMRRRVIRLPHPSGRCRAWNDSGAAARARRVLGRYVRTTLIR